MRLVLAAVLLLLVLAVVGLIVNMATPVAYP